MNSQNSVRYDWIDVSKAIGILFIYFGHWLTTSGNLAVFAYSFHLQLFFIVSGFFAVKQQNKKVVSFIQNQVNKLIIPFLFFVFINIVYFNLDGTRTLKEIVASFVSNFTDFSKSVSPELWFLPALFCISVIYYFLLKLSKSKILVFILAATLYVINKAYRDTVIGFVLIPFINFMGISAVPEYLFFYSMGALVFPYISLAANKLSNEEEVKFKRNLYVICSILFVFTILIYLKKPDMFILYFYKYTGISTALTDSIIRLILTIVICSTVFFISYLFRNSKFMLNIGRNTIILLGLEFMVKDFLVLNLIPMFNFGIITLNSTVQVVTISMLMIIAVMPLFKPLNQHLPFLLGMRNKQVNKTSA